MRDKAKQVFHPKLSRAATQVANPTTAILIMMIIIFYEDDFGESKRCRSAVANLRFPRVLLLSSTGTRELGHWAGDQFVHS